MSKQFITDIVIVSHKDKCPPGYTIVYLTTGGHDADLYEGSIAKRGERYLCFAQTLATQTPGSSTVITELNIVKDKDVIPTGFTAVKNCSNDTSEKALRKHMFCIKTSSVQNAQSSVVDIKAVKRSKGESAPQNYYTITNDVNGIQICFEVTPVVQRPPMQYPYNTNMSYRPPNMQASYPVYTQGVPYPSPAQLTAAVRMPDPTHESKSARQSNLTKQPSISKLASAIQGIQFQVNPKFEKMWKSSNVSNKPTNIQSFDDIEKKYEYTFETEQSLLRSR